MLRRGHRNDTRHFRRIDPRLQSGVHLVVAELQAGRRRKAGNGCAGDQACGCDGRRSQQCIAPTEPHCHRAPPAPWKPRRDERTAFSSASHRAVRRGQHRPPGGFGDQLPPPAPCCIARARSGRNRASLSTPRQPAGHASRGRRGRARPARPPPASARSRRRQEIPAASRPASAGTSTAGRSCGPADGLLDHRFVRLEHRHRRVSAGDRLDAGAECRAGEQDRVRAGSRPRIARVARKRSVMASVSPPSRARSADRLSSSKFISRASGQSFANDASIGAIECFRAWIERDAHLGQSGSGAVCVNSAAPLHRLSLERKRVHQAALAPGGVQAAIEF